ncbi:MAG: trypco2 family protein [Polyangiaceae bacterium]
MDDDRISLSEWIASIRAELTEAAERQVVREAVAAADQRPLTVRAMQVKEIRLELEVSTERLAKSSGKASAGFKFWVLASSSIGGEHERQAKHGSLQRVILTLEPKDLFMGDGKEKDIT